MQEYSEKDILQQFDEIIVLTERMNNAVLTRACEVKALEEFYSTRMPLLKRLAEWKQAATNATQNFLQQWNARAAALAYADRELLSALNTLKEEYQEKLRDSVKRKYLLIYSKGNNHGY